MKMKTVILGNIGGVFFLFQTQYLHILVTRHVLLICCIKTERAPEDAAHLICQKLDTTLTKYNIQPF